jgi:hypothetical protein
MHFPSAVDTTPGNEPRLAPQEIDLDMKTGMKIAIVRGR